MKLALIQTKGQDIACYEETRCKILSLLQQAGLTGADFILLPECAFPGYAIGLAADDKWKEAVQDFLTEVGRAAAAMNAYVAIGAALPADGALTNSLIVFGRQGQIIGQWNKSNLWHFDRQWFNAGNEFPIFETEFGTVGAMICADGRIPEIARILRLRGACLIIDAVNLVASAFTPTELSNPQCTYMLPTRALENGVYIAACNKSGVEDGVVTLAGSSFVVDPNGKIIARCSPDAEEILTCDIDLKALPPIPQRKPSLYGTLTANTEELPAWKERRQAYNLSTLECYTALNSFLSGDREEYVRQAERSLRVGNVLGAKLTILPHAGNLLYREELLELCPLIPEDMAAVAAYESGGVSRAALLSREGALAELAETHSPASSGPIEVVELFPGFKAAAIFGDEMLIPEVSRVAALLGADIIIWYDRPATHEFYSIMRTRASENRVFVARMTPPGGDDCCTLVSPDGGLLCTTFAGQAHTASSMVYTALSRSKTVVPGTDILKDRIPGAYTILTES